jgi:hypothetical protein
MSMNFSMNADWTDSLAQGLAKQIKGLFPAETLWQGLELLHQNGVYQFAWDNKTKVSAKVGKEAWRCSVDFGFLPFSRCSCRSTNSCVHMAALLCAALSSQDVPLYSFVSKYELVHVVHGKELAKMSVEAERLKAQQQAASAAPSSAAIKPAKSSRSPIPLQAGTPLPAPGDGCHKWHRFFVEQMPDYSLDLTRYVTLVEGMLLRPADSWKDDSAKALYRLHALWYSFHLLDLLSQRNPMVIMYARDSLKSSLERKLNEALEQAGEVLREPHAEPLIADLLAMIHDYGFREQRDITDWNHLYRGFWAILPNSPQRLKEERKWLESQLGTMAKDQATYLLLKLISAMTHILQLTEGPETATVYLLQHWMGSPESFYPYLDDSVQKKDWHGLALWLDTLSRLAVFRGTEAHATYLIPYWEPLAEGTLHPHQKPEAYSQFLEKLLPLTFHRFAKLLLQKKDYRGWVDLHLAYTRLPDESKGFDEVERHAPEELLPVYHCFAEEWIEERRRDGYRNAVAHLRFLKQLYTRLKQTDKWRAYLEQLLTRYSRLKVLQEEARKGGLFEP